MTTVQHVRDADDFARLFDVSRETAGRLEIYAALLVKWQKTINLVAQSTVGDVWHRHFADSAQVVGVALSQIAASGSPPLPNPPPQGGRESDLFLDLASRTRLKSHATPSPLVGEGRGGGEPQVSIVGAQSTGRGTGSMPAAAPHPGPLPLQGQGEREQRHWLDLGSGGGFPGLVAAILLAERGGWRVTLVESDQRKCAFLREVVRETGLKAAMAVDIVADRIESAANHSRVGIADVVSARALAALPRLLGWSAPFFSLETVGVFLKGREAVADVEAAQGLGGWAFALVPSVTEAGASVVVVRRI